MRTNGGHRRKHDTNVRVRRTWPRSEEHVIADSDLHVMEPPDLWQRYIDPAYAHAAPIGLTEIPRDMRVRVKNHTLLRLGGVRPLQVDGRKTGWREEHDSVYADAEARGWDPASQIEAMDVEGLDLAVLFPSRGLFVLGLDSVEAIGTDGLEPAFATAIARAYNDWLADFCSPRARPPVRRGHGRAPRHRGRGARGPPLRRGARLQGDLPRARLREPPAVAPPGLRPAVGRDPAARRPDRVPRRRPDLPHARLLARRVRQADDVAHVQPAARRSSS